VRAASMKNSYDLQVKQGDRMAQAAALQANGNDPVAAAKWLAARGFNPEVLTGMATAEQARGAATQKVQGTAIENARGSLTAFNPDGSENKGLSAASYSAVNKIIPGFSNMGEATRERMKPHADALAGIYQKTTAGDQMGFDKVNPFERRSPRADSLPDLKGGTMKRAGIDGNWTPGLAPGEWYVTMKDGTQKKLGALTEKEVALVKRNTLTGSWAPLKEMN
jgi:hypothetical protein